MSREKSPNANRKVTVTGLLVTGIFLLVYIVSHWLYTTIDTTEERRFTLTPATEQLLKEQENRIYIRVLLDGQFPAGFKRLRDATSDILRQFAQRSDKIDYVFENPNTGSVEAINEKRKALAEKGIVPTQLRVSAGAQASTQYIYPYAIVNIGTESVAVALLQDDIPGADKELILNNSIALLEYKLADGIQKLNQYAKKMVSFTTGQGELSPLQTASIEQALRSTYMVNRINLDSLVQIPTDIAVLVIAKPTEAFSEAHLFMLDQYIMNGGNVLFLIDPLVVSLDSINLNKNYIPMIRDLGLDPLLFKLGARVNPNLVLDLQCTRIPMVVGMQGDKPQTELFPWYYHALVSSASDHPVTKGLDRIQLEFPASVDTIQTAAPIGKTILLTSSQHSRIQLTPVRLNFGILREAPDPALFNKGPQGFAVLLEGAFESMYKNRLSQGQMDVLKRANLKYKSNGEPAKIIVVTDGDIIKNLVNAETGEIAPIGYNKYENTSFTGNRDFLLNAIEYMVDNSGLLAARSKDVKLRLLDTVKAKEEGVKWQLINILGPVGLIVLIGLVYHFIRKRKYGIPA